MEKEEFNQRFGAYVKYMRKQNNLSQVDLAVKLGNNFQNVSSLERGEFNPTLFSVDRMATAFGVSLSSFVEGFEKFREDNEE